MGKVTAAPGARWALALLLGINLFNYIDRQILSATLPKIKLDTTIFEPNARYVNTKLGILTTAFMVSYMCLSPLFGRLGDVISRWAIIGIAVIFWSLATGGTGLALGYGMLFFTRCLVGVGEAAYGPIAPAMLSDLYPVDHRGRVMSWFYMAIPVGSALGFVIGSTVADTSLGWRGSFLTAVLPGIALGICCFFMKSSRAKVPLANIQVTPGVQGPSAATPSYRKVLVELTRNRSFILCCAGMTASTFVLGGVASYMQMYLFEREARFAVNADSLQKLEMDEQFRRSDGTSIVPDDVRARLKTGESPTVMTVHEFQQKLQGTPTAPGLLTADDYREYQKDVFEACTAPGSLTNTHIGVFMGAIVVLSGLIATLLGGMAGDFLRKRGVRGAYFHVAGWGMIIAFPFFLGMLYTRSMPLTWGLLFVAVFFLFFNTGPANTILANVTRSKIRATAFAINILIIHALGDAISPLVIGWLDDEFSLQTAFVGVAFLIPVSGILWIRGARYLDEDTKRAELADGADKAHVPER